MRKTLALQGIVLGEERRVARTEGEKDFNPFIAKVMSVEISFATTADTRKPPLSNTLISRLLSRATNVGMSMRLFTLVPMETKITLSSTIYHYRNLNANNSNVYNEQQLGNTLITTP